MELKSMDVYVIDGETADGRLAQDRRFRHLELSALTLENLPENAFAILNLQGGERQQVLGAFFRQKRPFVLGGIGDISEGDLERLCETARRKKARAWALGGLRLHPVIAASKEIITGGCLGELTRLSVQCGGELGHAGKALLLDAVGWMCGTQEKGKEDAVRPAVKMTNDDRCLEITAVGTAGELFAMVDIKADSGSMTTTINHHRRARQFGPADTFLMELNVLAALVPTMTATLPGIVPLAELASALKGLEDKIDG